MADDLAALEQWAIDNCEMRNEDLPLEIAEQLSEASVDTLAIVGAAGFMAWLKKCYGFDPFPDETGIERYAQVLMVKLGANSVAKVIDIQVRDDPSHLLFVCIDGNDSGECTSLHELNVLSQQ